MTNFLQKNYTFLVTSLKSNGIVKWLTKYCQSLSGQTVYRLFKQVSHIAQPTFFRIRHLCNVFSRRVESKANAWYTLIRCPTFQQCQGNLWAAVSSTHGCSLQGHINIKIIISLHLSSCHIQLRGEYQCIHQGLTYLCFTGFIERPRI